MPQINERQKELRSKIRTLLELWKVDWANADYLSVILPRLLEKPESGNRREQSLIEDILVLAEDADFDHSDLAKLAATEWLKIELAGEVIPELEKDLRNFQLTRAQSRYEQYQEALDSRWYEERRAERIRSRRRTIQKYLSSYQFSDASDWLGDSKEVLRQDEVLELDEWFKHSLEQAVEGFIAARIEPFLQRYQFDKAREAFGSVEEFAGADVFESHLAKYKAEKRAIEEATQLKELLARQDFQGAQRLFSESSTLTPKQFSQLMGSYVVEYFQRSCGFQIDDHKARAMSTTAHRTLVEARAGSGKTTLLAYFVRLLHEKLGVELDEILVMAFNRTAAKRIGFKINEILGEEVFTNARTFHSLAWHLAEGCGWTKVLSDDQGWEVYEQERRRFLEETWKDVRRSHPRLWTLALLVFRRELSPQEVDLNPDSEDYYLYRRNECQTSLRGENVKSLGEKIIADFLLEHDIHYSYERSYFWDKRLYRPDFALFDSTGREVILEHWAIDPHQSSAQVPAHWAKSTEQYREELDRKREYWRAKDKLLLETNASEVARLGREGFERHLRVILEQANFQCRKLKLSDIISKISDQQTRRLVGLLGQCISLAKKARLAPKDVLARYRSADVTDAKVKAFGRIAWLVYQSYEKRMEEAGFTDYDSLLELAAHHVEKTHGNLVVQDETRGQFHLQKLKWILMDEYQDFSALFDRMLRAISTSNPSLRTLSVGDNWQAINGFAGSDTRYIDCFEELNQETSHLRFVVPVNRRSEEKIVAAGNVLMKDVPGDRAIPREGAGQGTVEVCHVDDIYVEMRKYPEYRDQYEADKKYLVTRPNGGESIDPLTSKYLKLVTQIILPNPYLSYSVLTRTNRLGTISIREFERHLRDCLGGSFLAEMKKSKKSIDVSTAHRYKGGESDVSIVLRVVNRQFPLVHPDSALLAPLGQTPDKIIREERRLFYVAISRAKERLILVTERNRESLFLEEITGRTF